MRGYYIATIIAVTFFLVISGFYQYCMIKRFGLKFNIKKRSFWDYIVLICIILYFYLIFASSFGLPVIGSVTFFRYYVHWYGSTLSFIGLIWYTSAIILLGSNNRFNSDKKLITHGSFSINRNPVYTGLLLFLAGVFITYANWIFIVYFIAGLILFHLLIIREEKMLKKLYGDKYNDYCKIVRRYF